MEILEFLLIITSFATVLFWYLQNAVKDAKGDLGLFALRLSENELTAAKPRRSYRIRPRKTPRRGVRFDVDTNKSETLDAQATYRIRDESAQTMRRFRRQDEARYRVKDKIKSYRSSPDAEVA